jgi:hypothetical protein
MQIEALYAVYQLCARIVSEMARTRKLNIGYRDFNVLDRDRSENSNERINARVRI